MKVYKIFFYTSFLLFFSMTVNAQTALRGKVIDAKDKEGVIAASVAEIDNDGRTVSSTVTDIEGNFALKVKSISNRLKISSIGYSPLTVSIDNRPVINISLKANTKDLEAVVIQGQRTVNNGLLNVDPKHNTMATATINAKDLEELAATSIDQALNGRLPGVDIGSQSGDPGAGMSIRIRGTATLNGNAQPMVVVDNMPFETEIPSDFNFGNADEQGYAQLLSIAPSDIKEITVLKDAASTAMWGSRAANGVIVITTKRGTIGKPQINYTMRGSLNKQPATFPMLSGDDYSVLVPEMVRNSSGVPMNIANFKEFAYDPYDPFFYYNYSKNTDWLNEITQIGYVQQHDVNIQGGGEKAKYYLAVGYTNQQGTTIGTGLDAIRTRVNLDYKVSSKIQFSSDFSYSRNNVLANFTNPRGEAYTKMPNMSPYLYDEYGNLTSEYFSPERNVQGNYLDKDNNTYNPVAMAKAAYSRQIGNRLIPSFTLRYNIRPELVASLQLRFDVNNVKTNNFLPQVATGRPFTETAVNNASDSDGDSYNTFGAFNVSYTPQFKSDKHRLTLVSSIQTRVNRSLSNTSQVANTASAFFQDPSNSGITQGDRTNLASSIGLGREIGALISAQYTLLNRYDFTLLVRSDGSSKLSPDYRFTTFPSLSTRWHLSDERLIKNFDWRWLDDLSLRFSYGKSGNAPDGSYYSIVRPSSMVRTSVKDVDYVGSYADQAGVLTSNLQITTLKPEKVTGINFGFNLWMFKSRVKLETEVYRNVTKDLFFKDLTIPNTSGFGSISTNFGQMTNSGWELLIQTTPVKSKNWNMNINFNFANNQNVLNEVSEFFARENKSEPDKGGQYKTFLQIGNPFGSFYGYKTKGVYKDLDATIVRDAAGNKIVPPNGETKYMRYNYPRSNYVFQPGDVEYVDINNDGNINYVDQVYLGNGLPKLSGGFGYDATYKGRLSLKTFFNYRLDYQIINQAKMTTMNMTSYDNQSTAVLRRWRNSGDVTDVPRAVLNSPINWLGSDRFVEDASFLRLRQVTVNYVLPKKVSEKLKMRRANAYVTMENVYTWTNYTGQDPDRSLFNSASVFGYPTDNSTTPPARTLVLGLSLSL
jgi:TonB-linked SusC/RagA family outer membrane protein